jgi:hypothetical protein
MYKLINNPLSGQPSVILRLSDNTYIPMDERNYDYVKYLKWLEGYEPNGLEYIKTAEKNEPLPADPIPENVIPAPPVTE